MESAAGGVQSVEVSPLVRVGQSRDGGDIPGEDLMHKADGWPGAGVWEAAEETQLENARLLDSLLQFCVAVIL